MAVKITAKVIVAAVKDAGPPEDGQKTITFNPDYADGANAEWAKYTPALTLGMVVRGEVADQFEQGDRFTLTFEKN